MDRKYANRRRFVIMPNRGISGKVMQAALFQDNGPNILAETLTNRMGRFSDPSHSAFAAEAPTAQMALSSVIDAADFEILSQRFDDGPVTVKMSHAARLALEASNPGIRVLPVTRYYLPGVQPRRTVKGVEPASQPAGESAVNSGGAVFADDAKQHFLKGQMGGAAGKNVLIGVIDTGIDNSHPALHGQVSALRSFIPGAAPTAGGPADWGAAAAAQSGHGTHVAGIIAAAPGFGGPAGVAPNARLVSYRIFPDGKGPQPAENPVIIDSIRAAIEDGCHIINLSIEGATLKDDGVRSAVMDAWDNGVICVAAAGNGFGKPVSYPAALPHCMAVTACGRIGTFPAKAGFKKFVSDQRASTDNQVFLASFSNYGPQVQFTAPGHAIVSTFPHGG
ncbi:MAG: hypothetical protein RL367_1907, partial [Pseudomonadota bacterium]